VTPIQRSWPVLAWRPDLECKTMLELQAICYATGLHRRARPSPRFRRKTGAGWTLCRSCRLTNRFCCFLFRTFALCFLPSSSISLPPMLEPVAKPGTGTSTDDDSAEGSPRQQLFAYSSPRIRVRASSFGRRTRLQRHYDPSSIQA